MKTLKKKKMDATDIEKKNFLKQMLPYNVQFVYFKSVGNID